MKVQRWLYQLWAQACRHWQMPAARQSVLGLALALVLAGCRSSSAPPPREISLQQSWELEPGDKVAGYLVAASLGDISIELRGKPLRAPFSGEVEPAIATSCLYFSTSEIPAYLFRFCGLKRPHLGAVNQGETIGSGQYVHFATLRRQPDGTWAIVEPSKNVLERALSD